ncbi:MAG TPA: hypothetical protein VIU63_09250 [Nitrospira sp.]
MEYHRDNRRNWESTRLIRPWILMCLAIIVFVPVSWAGTVLKLASLLTHPESYQLKMVRVTGIVADHQIKHIKRWAADVDKCVQTFTVKDETGSMEAAYGASCSGAMDLLRNRDRVTVDARFEWVPGKAGMLNVQSELAKVAPYP